MWIRRKKNQYLMTNDWSNSSENKLGILATNQMFFISILQKQVHVKNEQIHKHTLSYCGCLILKNQKTFNKTVNFDIMKYHSDIHNYNFIDIHNTINAKTNIRIFATAIPGEVTVL